MAREKDKEREHRIHYEIIVDAYFALKAPPQYKTAKSLVERAFYKAFYLKTPVHQTASCSLLGCF